jgi:hypothetical protein
METITGDNLQDVQPRKRSVAKRILKFFFWLFAVLIIIIGAIIAYFYFSESGKRDPFSVIPNDAVFIIETTNLTDGWVKLNDSKMWKHLMGNKKFEEINKSATSLDSLIRGNETLDMLFSDRKLLISAHMISLNDYDFIFAVDLKKISKITFLKDYISGIVSSYGFSLSKREFNGTEIMMLTDIKTKDVLNIAFADNVMVCSYSPMLIEKSIQQKDAGYWDKNKRFSSVAGEISSNKLFNFYLNYGKLDDYLKCYTSDSSGIINTLSEALSFSAFNVRLEEEQLIFDGYTGVVDSIPSYLNALLDVSPGKIRAHTIISDRAALYLSMCFSDFEDFYSALKKQFNAEDTALAKNYDKTIKKVEKYLKVNMDDDFFSWIGNEIAFVKMQPTANAREEDVVVTIHANDIENAKNGLDHLTSQVKKRTLGLAKFKDTEYKGYTIKYLGFSGFLKLFFGKLFSKIEKPYFTYIEDFVVMSNSPSCLMDIIDDYTIKQTLSENEAFMKFTDNFESKANVSIFVQMPKIYSHLYYYSKDEKRKGIQDNKDIILGFTRVGFQLIADDDLFKTKLVADFDEDAAFNDDLENIEAAAEELFVNEIDTGMFRIKLTEAKLRKDGPVRVLHADSMHVQYEGRVLDGAPDGLWRIYYISGKIAGAVTYENEKANGVALYYYDNDKQSTRAEASFKDDMLDGVYREYYENGERKATINYAEGYPDGDAEFFYDSGVLKIEGQYKKGLKVGKWKHFTETGEMVTKEKWKKGRKKGAASNEE